MLGTICILMTGVSVVLCIAVGFMPIDMYMEHEKPLHTAIAVTVILALLAGLVALFKPNKPESSE